MAFAYTTFEWQEDVGYREEDEDGPEGEKGARSGEGGVRRFASRKCSPRMMRQGGCRRAGRGGKLVAVRKLRVYTVQADVAQQVGYTI
jgi:hypothetical protein